MNKGYLNFKSINTEETVLFALSDAERHSVVNAEGLFFTIRYDTFKQTQGLFHSFNPHGTMARSHSTRNRDLL